MSRLTHHFYPLSLFFRVFNNVKTQFYDEFKRSDTGITVVLLLFLRQFFVRNQARMRLQFVVPLRTIRPPLFDASLRPNIAGDKDTNK